MLTYKRAALWLSIAVGYLLVIYGVLGLKERAEYLDHQNSLLKRIVALQHGQYEAVNSSNVLCERALVDIFHRLGLDEAKIPLITASAHRKAAGVGPVEDESGNEQP